MGFFQIDFGLNCESISPQYIYEYRSLGYYHASNRNMQVKWLIPGMRTGFLYASENGGSVLFLNLWN